jgi:branched-subunit amino acid transport protein AzlD
MTLTESIITVAAVVLATMFTRLVPFIAFPQSRPVPSYIKYLSKVLPSAAFALLVVYCYKDINILSGEGASKIVCGLVVAALQIWRKNMFLSMAAGTFLYMIWVQNMR